MHIDCSPVVKRGLSTDCVEWGRSGSYLPAMDSESPEPIDDQDAIGRLLWGPVRLVASVAVVALAASAVLALWPHTVGL